MVSYYRGSSGIVWDRQGIVFSRIFFTIGFLIILLGLTKNHLASASNAREYTSQFGAPDYSNDDGFSDAVGELHSNRDRPRGKQLSRRYTSPDHVVIDEDDDFNENRPAPLAVTAANPKSFMDKVKNVTKLTLLGLGMLVVLVAIVQGLEKKGVIGTKTKRVLTAAELKLQGYFGVVKSYYTVLMSLGFMKGIQDFLKKHPFILIALAAITPFILNLAVSLVMYYVWIAVFSVMVAVLLPEVAQFLSEKWKTTKPAPEPPAPAPAFPLPALPAVIGRLIGQNNLNVEENNQREEEEEDMYRDPDEGRQDREHKIINK